MSICKKCIPNAEIIGELVPDFPLILIDGKYGLIIGKGHSIKDFHSFSETPFPDPDVHFDNDDPICDKWYDLAKEINDWEISITQAHKFYEACKKEFENQTQYTMFEHWLYNKVGLLIEFYEKRNVFFIDV